MHYHASLINCACIFLTFICVCASTSDNPHIVESRLGENVTIGWNLTSYSDAIIKVQKKTTAVLSCLFNNTIKWSLLQPICPNNESSVDVGFNFVNVSNSEIGIYSLEKDYSTDANYGEIWLTIEDPKLKPPVLLATNVTLLTCSTTEHEEEAFNYVFIDVNKRVQIQTSKINTLDISELSVNVNISCYLLNVNTSLRSPDSRSANIHHEVTSASHWSHTLDYTNSYVASTAGKDTVKQTRENKDLVLILSGIGVVLIIMMVAVIWIIIRTKVYSISNSPDGMIRAPQMMHSAQTHTNHYQSQNLSDEETELVDNVMFDAYMDRPHPDATGQTKLDSDIPIYAEVRRGRK